MNEAERFALRSLFPKGVRNEVALLALGAAILAVLFWSFGNAGLVESLIRPRIGPLLAYLALAAVVLLGYSVRWGLVARALGAAPPLSRLVSARLAGDAVGTLIPSGQLAGEPVRMALISAAGVEGTRAVAAVTLDRILEWLGNMVCAITYVTIFWLAHRDAHTSGIPLLYLGGMLLLLLTLVVPLLLMRRGDHPLTALHRRWRATAPDAGSWRARLEETEHHLVSFCQRHPRTFVQCLLLSLTVEAVMIVEYHCLLEAFAVDVTVPTLLLVLIGSGISRAAPTPAALGALEATQVGIASMAGDGAALGFTIGLILRLHETVWMALGLIVFLGQGTALMRVYRLRRGVSAPVATQPRDAT